MTDTAKVLENVPYTEYEGILESIYNRQQEDGKYRSILGIRLDSGDIECAEFFSGDGISEEYADKRVRYKETEIVEEGDGKETRLVKRVTRIQDLRLV